MSTDKMEQRKLYFPKGSSLPVPFRSVLLKCSCEVKRENLNLLSIGSLPLLRLHDSRQYTSPSPSNVPYLVVLSSLDLYAHEYS